MLQYLSTCFSFSPHPFVPSSFHPPHLHPYSSPGNFPAPLFVSIPFDLILTLSSSLRPVLLPPPLYPSPFLCIFFQIKKQVIIIVCLLSFVIVCHPSQPPDPTPQLHIRSLGCPQAAGHCKENHSSLCIRHFPY